MRKFFASCFFVLFALLANSQTVKVYISDSIEVRNDKHFYLHTVTQGQTVYSIARAYDVGVDEIYFENPETKEGISVDQVIWIPTINKETELNREIRKIDYEFFYHIAKQNESLNSLAYLYNIPVNYIRKANPEISEPLKDGQYVRIPVDDAFTKLNDGAGGDEDVSFDPGLPVIPDFRHSVSAGETLYSIAKKYQVTVNQIRSVNPGLAQTLEIGDRLRIPRPTVTDSKEIVEGKKEEKPQEQKEPEYYNHRVKRKETLYSISRIYGVTVPDLYDANPGLTSRIAEGQVIKVPNKYIDKPYIIYTAERKIRLSKIAKLYQVPVSKLQNENPSLGSRILPGQKVRIPVGTKAKIKKDVEEEVIKEEEPEIVVEPKPVKAGCDDIVPDYRKTFRIALMIPLYLEETDSLDVEQFLVEPQNDFFPFRFIRFYEGAILALDSLRSQGFNIELFVYDVDQSITKTAKVLQKPELRNMDLIIGPLQYKSFSQVALFAGNFNIPIVNPFSFRSEIVEKYKTVIKAKPGTAHQAELLPSLIKRDYDGAKIFLITHTSYQNADEVIALQSKLQNTLKPNYKVPNTDLHNLAVAVAYRDEEFEGDGPLPNYKFEGNKIISEQLALMPDDSTTFENPLIRINYIKDSLYPFFNNASPLRQNLAIIYGESKAFIMDAMNRLNEHRDTFNIQVIGMPTLERFSNLDLIQSNNMNLTYFSTTYIDYDDENIQDYIFKFRNSYHTDPGIYGFSGFDITYYFVNALVNLDYRLSSCFDQFPQTMLLNDYEMNQVGKSGNFENTYWNLLRYEYFSKNKLPDPVPEKNDQE